MVQENRYMRADDFFRKAVPNTTAEEVRKEMGAELMRPITTSRAYEIAGINTGTWNKLGHQIVGAEVD